MNLFSRNPFSTTLPRLLAGIAVLLLVPAVRAQSPSPSPRARPTPAPTPPPPPLLDAAERGDFAAVRTALDVDHTPVDLRDDRGWTALIAAAKAGREDVVRLLLAHGADAGARIASDCPVIVFAAGSGNVAVVDLLLAAGARPEVACRNGQDALIQAIRGKHVEVVRRLLAKRVPVNHFPITDDRDGHTWSPLFWALNQRDPALVNPLLDAGADLEARNNDGETALIFAANWGHYEMVRLLVNRGADVRAHGSHGLTALHHLAWHGGSREVALLLDHGADPGVKATDEERFSPGLDLAGYTPADLARQHSARLRRKPNGFDDIVARLAEGPSPPPAEALARALRRGDPDRVRAALGRGAAPSAPGADGLAPIFLAVAAVDSGPARVLLDAGADPNARDLQGRTPLAVALANAQAAVRALPSGGDAGSRGAEARALRERHQALIEVLHQAGARE